MRSVLSISASTVSAASTSVMFCCASNCSFGEARATLRIAGGEIAEAHIAQGSLADRRAVGSVRAIVGQLAIRLAECGGDRSGDRAARILAHRMDRLDIDDFHLVGEARLARQDQRLGGESTVARGLARACAAPRRSGRRRAAAGSGRGAIARRVRAAPLSPRAARRPTAPPDRCRGSPEILAGRAACPAASPAPKSRAAATAPAAPARRQSGRSAAPRRSPAAACPLAPPPHRPAASASRRRSGPRNPSRIGIGTGSFSGWPGVGGVFCDTVSS